MSNKKMHVLNYLLLMIILFFTSTSASAACQKPIRIQLLESEKDHLIHSLLLLSLSKVGRDNCLITNTEVMTNRREHRQVQKNLLDIIWTTSDLYKTLTPIRIPIFRGLLGYRILVIRAGEQDLYNSVNKLNDLKKFQAGLGNTWGDTKIFTEAKLPVVTVNRGRHLWPMLAQKRFDYIPLGINEPWADLALRAELKLAAEQNILIHYPIGLYFHVNKKNKSLEKLLIKGIKMAIEDGSYDQLLQKSRMVQATLKYANAASRKTITLSNNNFTKNIPIENMKYWLSPDELLDFLAQAKII